MQQSPLFETLVQALSAVGVDSTAVVADLRAAFMRRLLRDYLVAFDSVSIATIAKVSSLRQTALRVVSLSLFSNHIHCARARVRACECVGSVG